MQVARALIGLLVAVAAGTLVVAQGTAGREAPSRTSPDRAAAPAPAQPLHADLNQLMRGMLFTTSNVVFWAQINDPSLPIDAPVDGGPSASTDPLTGIYAGWEAVENSGLALAEAATLVALPGRVCANGKAVPVGKADWATFVQELRDAGMAAYTAARAKDRDALEPVANQLLASCTNCHDVYRDAGAIEDRCR